MAWSYLPLVVSLQIVTYAGGILEVLGMRTPLDFGGLNPQGDLIRIGETCITFAGVLAVAHVKGKRKRELNPNGA